MVFYKKIVGFITYWIPPLLWMGMIFYFSSQQRLTITTTYIFDFIFFKFLHMVEYAILYFLLFRALYSTKQKHNFNKASKTALGIAILYALSDEIHQYFVPTREGKIRDILIDSLGIVIIYTITKRFFSYIKHIL